MLLVTVVTVGFVRLMVADQQQASNNDLSQSALDSAMAGVEDAKRALIKYQQDCKVSVVRCGEAAQVVSGADGRGAVCNAGLREVVGTGVEAGEIRVQQSVGDQALDQAYTCVKIMLKTPNYEGNLAANTSQLVPLISDTAFDRVVIEWFSDKNVASEGGGSNVDLEGVGSGQPLYTRGEWPSNRPSLMRAQVIQYANTFTVGNFDAVKGTQSNGATMFLYPTSQPNIGAKSFTEYDNRKTDIAPNPLPKDSVTTPTAVSCKSNLNSGGYACKSELILPQAIGASGNERTAFLRLASFYNASAFRITLSNGAFNPENPLATLAEFDSVQPEIDSTGRANDLFKRVVSRVSLFDTTFPYPEGTIDITGDFCKDFAITKTQYIPGPNGCTP